MKDEIWTVAIYNFNNTHKLWEYDTTFSYKTNDALLRFIKDISTRTDTLRYVITYRNKNVVIPTPFDIDELQGLDEADKEWVKKWNKVKPMSQ